MVDYNLVALFIVIGIEQLAIMFYFLHITSYNIPVTIFRFVGGQDRPIMITTKARKRVVAGVSRLWVKGYKTPIRDFLSENYYPTVRGKFGGLVLWEFEDQLLTPAIAVREEKKLSKEENLVLSSAIDVFKKHQLVSFDFDQRLHNHLKLKTVDDVDVEFALQETLRVDSQYSSGWQDFFAKYAGHIVVVIAAGCLLAGFVVWMQHAPEMMAKCAGAARDIVETGLLERASTSIAPGG